MFIIRYLLEISLIETRLRVAIMGSSINGIFTAWKFSEKGYQVDLFDSNSVLSQASSSPSKPLNGGKWTSVPSTALKIIKYLK